MKPVDLKPGKQNAFFNVEKKKNSKIKFGYHNRTSISKNIFSKDYNTNVSEVVFVTEEVKNTVPWANRNDVNIIGTLLKKTRDKSNRV